MSKEVCKRFFGTLAVLLIVSVVGFADSSQAQTIVGSYTETWTATKYRVASMKATARDNPSKVQLSYNWVCLGPAEWHVTGSYSDGTTYDEYWRAKPTYGSSGYNGDGWISSHNVQAALGGTPYDNPSLIIDVDYSFLDYCPNRDGAQFTANIPGYGSESRIMLPTGLYGALITTDTFVSRSAQKNAFYLYTMGVRSIPVVWSVDGTMTKP